MTPTETVDNISVGETQTIELNISSSNPEPEGFRAFCEKKLAEQYTTADITVRVVNADSTQTGSIRVDTSDLWHEYCNS